jgi:hypothetical protein
VCVVCGVRGEAVSAEKPALCRTWRVGRYTATLTAPFPRRGQICHATIEWSPRQPKDLTAEEWEAYRAGRDECLRELGLSGLATAL